LFDLYLSSSALEKARTHFSAQARSGLEGIGLLIGDVFSWKGRKYAVAEEYLTGGNKASSVAAKFDERAFGALAQVLAKKFPGKIFVGWAHSHPNYGCFLSQQDVATQENYFPEEWHVAFVVDPVRKEEKAFKLRDGKVVEASYAVVKKK